MNKAILIGLATMVLLQSPGMRAAETGDTAAPAKAQLSAVKFESTFPDFEPQHFVVSIDAGGHGTYLSEGETTKESGEAYSFDFVASEPVRNRVFELARAANYFQGDFE